jgi:hypothetical protein
VEKSRTAQDSVEPAKAVALVAAVMLDGSVTEQSSARLLVVIERLLEFLTAGHGVTDLDQTTPAMAQAFVLAPDTDGAAPSLSIMHLRRCAVRILFRIARQLGLVRVDPTVDLDLPPRAASVLRRLTNAEATLCRAMSMNQLEPELPVRVLVGVGLDAGFDAVLFLFVAGEPGIDGAGTTWKLCPL